MTPANRVIQDAYELLEEIGQGGMAQVFRARQLSLNRIVAIKEIKPAFTNNPEVLERFKREARTAANLTHENIVQVYNFSEPSRGSLFIVLEYMEGQDLKTLLRRAGPPPPRIAAILCREAARALAYAHARHLVHRDVKPANIMVSDQGEVKLMDFGIVREMDSDLTRTGAFLGTPSYMSPEQFLGEEITPASDLFSLGIVLFELLTGEKPFKADNEASLSKKVRIEREPKVRSLNPKVPRRLAAAVHLCLRKDPDKRPLSADNLIFDLEKFLRTRGREDERKELKEWLREAGAPENEPEISTVPINGKRPPLIDFEPDSEPLRGSPPPRLELDDRSPVRGRLPEPERRPRSEVASERRRPMEDDRKPDPSELDAIRPRSGPRQPRAEEAPEVPSPGEWLMKWAWRLILLAIIALAAVVMFIRFNPDALRDPGNLNPSRLLDLITNWK